MKRKIQINLNIDELFRNFSTAHDERVCITDRYFNRKTRVSSVCSNYKTESLETTLNTLKNKNHEKMIQLKRLQQTIKLVSKLPDDEKLIQTSKNSQKTILSSIKSFETKLIEESEYTNQLNSMILSENKLKV